MFMTFDHKLNFLTLMEDMKVLESITKFWLKVEISLQNLFGSFTS